jgi:hypothetical protein
MARVGLQRHGGGGWFIGYYESFPVDLPMRLPKCFFCTCIQNYRTLQFHNRNLMEANWYVDIDYSVPQMVLIVTNKSQSAVP